jgi:hypothetical protein
VKISAAAGGLPSWGLPPPNRPPPPSGQAPRRQGHHPLQEERSSIIGRYDNIKPLTRVVPCLWLIPGPYAMANDMPSEARRPGKSLRHKNKIRHEKRKLLTAVP